MFFSGLFVPKLAKFVSEGGFRGKTECKIRNLWLYLETSSREIDRTHTSGRCVIPQLSHVSFIHCLGTCGNGDQYGWWVKAFLNCFIPVECRMLIKTVFASTFRINRCQDPGDGKSLWLRSRIWRKGFPLLYFLLLLHGLFLPQQFHCGSGQPESFCSFGHYALFLLWM